MSGFGRLCVQFDRVLVVHGLLHSFVQTSLPGLLPSRARHRAGTAQRIPEPNRLLLPLAEKSSGQSEQIADGVERQLCAPILGVQVEFSFARKRTSGSSEGTDEKPSTLALRIDIWRATVTLYGDLTSLIGALPSVTDGHSSYLSLVRKSTFATNADAKRPCSSAHANRAEMMPRSGRDFERRVSVTVNFDW